MPPKETSKYFSKKEIKNEPTEKVETSDYFHQKHIKSEPSDNYGHFPKNEIKTELPENGETSNYKTKTPTKKSPTKSPRKERKHIKIETPENWEILYENILEMRKEKNAPVDTMGCEKVQELSTDPKVQRFHCLVSLMLSSQTKAQCAQSGYYFQHF